MAQYTSHEAPARAPAALPVTPPPKLVGRDPVLAQIYAQLRDNRPVLIHGAAGVGKTAIAATLAGAYAQQPGGTLWLNVDDDSLESLIARVGRAYEIGEIMQSDNPIGLVGAVATTLAQQKPLLVLDGKMDEQVAAKFISRCAAGIPAILVSQTALDGPWTDVEIDPLEQDAAVAMFKQEALVKDNTQDANIGQMVGLVNHQPFAIGVLARAMLAAKQTPDSYVNVIQQVIGSTRTSGTQAALTASFSALNGALQGIILMMGATFRGEASAELLSMVSNAPADSVQQAMTMLAQLHLVERSQRYGEPYYHLHPIVYNFARQRLIASERLDGLQDKIREALLDYAARHGIDNPSAYNKLATEMDNFMAVAAWASERGDRDTANQLLRILTEAGNYVNRRGYVYELVELRNMGTGYATAFPAYPTEIDDDDDEEFEDQSSDEIAAPNIMAMLDDIDDMDDDLDYDFDDDEEFDDDILAPEDAIPTSAAAVAQPANTAALPDDIPALRTALASARQEGNLARQVELLRRIGRLQVDGGMDNEAIATYSEAVTAYEAIGDDNGLLDMLGILSSLMAKTDNWSAAVLQAERGSRLAQQLGEDRTRMQLLITLGDARQQLGESDTARSAYEEALTVTRSLNDSEFEGIVLYKLGYALLDGGNANRAIEMWEQALAMFKSQAKREYEGKVLGGLGAAYGDLERWAEAINFHTSALYIAREVNDREEEALQLNSLGFANLQTNNLGQSLLRYRQALHLALQSGQPTNIVTGLVDVAQLLLRSPKHFGIAEMLINTATQYAPTDKDVVQMKERVGNEIMLAKANGTELLPVKGDATVYAENAYRLLDE